MQKQIQETKRLRHAKAEAKWYRKHPKYIKKWRHRHRSKVKNYNQKYFKHTKGRRG